MKYFLAIIVSISLFQCKTALEEEPLDYRPNHHFTPPENWTNDPNGLVYLDGEYHLFYQYNPFGDTWGHMSWGHAVSRDLVTWEHLPVAIPEFDNGDSTTTMIFSGSAVVDSKNSSGFFEAGFTKGMVAVFTAHRVGDGVGIGQYQSLAFSSDKGRTWERYKGNPVLDLGMLDFRDPNVIWNEARNSWLMSVVKPKEYIAQFYESNDLKNWSLLSEFGKQGDTTRIWECPSLFKVPVEHSDVEKWVLMISSGHKSEGFVGMQYFVGDFDGTHFTSQEQKEILYVDAGKDFYAAIPFNNLSKGHNKPVVMGWTNNWTYANKIPTVGFRGGFSFPRELSLTKQGEVFKLKSNPISSPEIKSYPLSKGQANLEVDEGSFHLVIDADASDSFNVKMAYGKDEFIEIGYDLETEELYFDRRNSGQKAFSEDFASKDVIKVQAVDGKVKLDIFVDVSVVEVFVNDGLEVMTQQIFPTTSKVSVSLN